MGFSYRTQSLRRSMTDPESETQTSNLRRPTSSPPRFAVRGTSPPLAREARAAARAAAARAAGLAGIIPAAMQRAVSKSVTGSGRGGASEALLFDREAAKGKRKQPWRPGVKDAVIAVLALLLLLSLAGSRSGEAGVRGRLDQVDPAHEAVTPKTDPMMANAAVNAAASTDGTEDENDDDDAAAAAAAAAAADDDDMMMDENSESAEARLAAEEALNGAYPIQDDEIPDNSDASQDQEPLSPEELKLEEMAEEEIERAQSADAGREDWEGIPVTSLGGLYIQDGDKYMEAPDLVVPEKPMEPHSLYKKMWPQLEMHEEFYRQHSHKRYIPRIGQPITRQQFHEIFRKTSTPVIIPFKYMRNLGVLTKGWKLKDLRKLFPYEPKIAKKTALMRQEYNQQGLYKGKRDVDFGPALWKLEQDTKIVFGASGTGNRNIPRNMKLPPSELAKFNISYPPFLPSTDFQPPTMWMGTTSADTKMHHDCCDNWVSHIQGTKRWFIAPPTDSRKLWPNACVGKHTALCWSPLKFPFRKNLTPKERAMKEKLQYIDIDVRAGEMLYLPAGWWHMISNRGPTIMINFWAIGCANSQVALDQDPERTDRPDFHQCAERAKEYDAFVYGD